MPVFDFSNSKTEKKDPECTYTTFQSNEKVPSPEKPILIIDNKSRQWKHHSCGVFSNPNQKSSFEFKEQDGVFPADILKIDARFVSLVNGWAKTILVYDYLDRIQKMDMQSIRFVKLRLGEPENFQQKMDSCSL